MEPTPTPAQTVPTTEFGALAAMNVFKPIDGFIAVADILLVVTSVYWCLFGNPTHAQLFGLLLILIVSCQVWLILLALRILRNIVDIYIEVQRSSDITVKKLYTLANQP